MFVMNSGSQLSEMSMILHKLTSHVRYLFIMVSVYVCICLCFFSVSVWEKKQSHGYVHCYCIFPGCQSENSSEYEGEDSGKNYVEDEEDDDDDANEEDDDDANEEDEEDDDDANSEMGLDQIRCDVWLDY